MPNTEALLIQGGIAGVFAIFAIMLFREFIKYLNRRDAIIISLTNTVVELAQNIAILTEIVDAIRDCVQEGEYAGKAGKKLESLPRTTPRREIERIRRENSELAGE